MFKKYPQVISTSALLIVLNSLPAAGQLCHGSCTQNIGPGYYEISCDPDGDVDAFDCASGDCFKREPILPGIVY